MPFPTVVYSSSKVDLRQEGRRRKSEKRRYRMTISGQESKKSQHHPHEVATNEQIKI